jgi:hypothetical protein
MENLRLDRDVFPGLDEARTGLIEEAEPAHRSWPPPAGSSFVPRLSPRPLMRLGEAFQAPEKGNQRTIERDA